MVCAVVPSTAPQHWIQTAGKSTCCQPEALSVQREPIPSLPSDLHALSFLCTVFQPENNIKDKKKNDFGVAMNPDPIFSTLRRKDTGNRLRPVFAGAFKEEKPAEGGAGSGVCRRAPRWPYSGLESRAAKRSSRPPPGPGRSPASPLASPLCLGLELYLRRGVRHGRPRQGCTAPPLTALPRDPSPHPPQRAPPRRSSSDPKGFPNNCLGLGATSGPPNRLAPGHQGPCAECPRRAVGGEQRALRRCRRPPGGTRLAPRGRRRRRRRGSRGGLLWAHVAGPVRSGAGALLQSQRAARSGRWRRLPCPPRHRLYRRSGSVRVCHTRFALDVGEHEEAYSRVRTGKGSSMMRSPKEYDFLPFY
ncbi:hypothetical protein NN561_007888 [Cricetulus griseus]